MSGILKLSPAFKDYIWGGSLLKTEYNMTDMDRVAEAWVLSCHKDGASTVVGGMYDGRPCPKHFLSSAPRLLVKTRKISSSFLS